MTRGIGEFGVQEFVPEWVAVLVALVTQLGDIWFVSLLLGWLYLRTRREEVAILIAQTMSAIGLVFALKYVFALPRPDRALVALEELPATIQPLYLLTAHADGYGFPSGHAVVTTVVYVGLAGILSIGTSRQRYLAAGALVSIVSLSRILLGVHYLVDVVAGIALGLAFLVVSDALFDRYGSRRTVPFGVAFVLSIVALVATAFHVESIALFAATLAALVVALRPSLGRSLLAPFEN